MLVQHVNSGADVTVACLEVPAAEASAFGVMHVDAEDRIVSFVEKPAIPPEMPDRPGWALASMGIYVFKRDLLNDQLRRDAADPGSSRDFGKDMIPWLVANGKAIAHRFTSSCVRSRAESEVYWRDVGTLDAYWEANVDLTDVVPDLDLFDRNWPIWTYAEITPPAKFVHDVDGRRGSGVASLVSGGCIVSGAAVRRSLLFTGVHVHSYASVTNTVVLPYVDIARGARLSNVDRGRGSAHPAGARRGRGPGTRRAPLPPHRARHLPHHPADDRPARGMNGPAVLSVASEVFPLVKTGGLADVAGALPPALAAEGVAVRTLLPGYPAVLAALPAAETVHHWPLLNGGPARLLAARAAGLDLFVLDAPHLYDRPGNPYVGADGKDWPDNALRFGALGAVAAELGRGLLPAFAPDIVHAHDWQAGARARLPALRARGRARAP